MVPVVDRAVAGFGFRVTGLSAEGLSEDELNKLNAVADYRANGLTGANGEHPMLMKSLQAATIASAASAWPRPSAMTVRSIGSPTARKNSGTRSEAPRTYPTHFGDGSRMAAATSDSSRMFSQNKTERAGMHRNRTQRKVDR